MRNKIFTILALILTIVTLISVTVFAVSAEGSAPSVEIAKFNLVFEDNVYLKYAVRFDGVNDEAITADNIKMLYFTAPQSEYVEGKEKYSSDVVGYTTIDGVKHYTFEYRHISAKQMTEYVYSVAYIELDGVKYYSAPVKYSVLDYAYSRLGKTGVESDNEDLKNLLRATLEQGAMAQKYFKYNTDRLANAEYFLVEVVDGTLEDGFTKGLYTLCDTATLKANENEDGLVFFGWRNSSGRIVSRVNTAVISDFDKNEVYTSVWVEDINSGNDTLVTKTTGEIIVENYDLDAAEGAIIASGYLEGESYTYGKPSQSADFLVEVDTDGKAIAVKAYEYDDYKWYPVSVVLDPADGEDEIVALADNGNGTYSGEYTFDGNAFSVKVNYEAKIDIDEATQSALLNAPANIKNGLAALDKLVDADSNLQLMFEKFSVDGFTGLSGEMTVMDFIKILASDGVNFGFITLHFFNTPNNQTGLPAIEATEKLSAQMDNNASGKFDVCDSIAEYNSSASKVSYLDKNAASLLYVVKEMRANLWALYTANDSDPDSDAGASIWQSIPSLSGYIPDTGMVLSAIIQHTLKSWIDAADEVIASGALEADYAIADDLGEVEYLVLDSLVAAFDVANAKGSSVVVNESLVLDTNAISNNVSSIE